MSRRMRNAMLSIILVLALVLGVVPGNAVSSYASEFEDPIVVMDETEVEEVVDEVEEPLTEAEEPLTEAEEPLVEDEPEIVADETEEVTEEANTEENAVVEEDESMDVTNELKTNVDSLALVVGDTQQLKVTLNGTDVTSSCSFGSSDIDVVKVAAGGLVTAAAPGSGYITVIYASLGLIKEIPFSVIKKTTDGNVRYNVLIMDASNSVKGTPLKREKEAAKRFCKTILSADGDNYLAVISLNADAAVECAMTSSYSKLANAIDGVSCKYGTNLNEALKKAKSILDAAPSGTNILKNIVICSDGLPQCGSKKATGKYKSSDHKYYQYANAAYATDVKAKNAGYFVYSLGFYNNSTGNNLTFGKRHMKDLASKDKYYEVDDPEDIDDAMDDISDQITKLTISKTVLKIYVGQSANLTAYQNGVEVAAEWSTSDSGIATVNENGRVTGVKAGTATVVAKYGAGKVICTVYVYNGPTTKLNKSSVSIYKGCSTTLKATTVGISKKVTWKSSNKAIATVNKDGKVTGVKVGSCTVSATCNGVKATCTVKVLKPTIKLNKSKLYLYKGQSETLKATVNGKSKKVTWTSSKKSVATVTSSGKVTGKKLGTTYVTAKCNGVTAKCKVIVERKHPPYSFFCETNKTKTKVGDKYINEQGAMLKYNEGGKITKAGVYIYNSGGYDRFIVACRGENLTYVECDCYLGLNGKMIYDYYNTKNNGYNYWHMNHFYFSKDSYGVYSYGGYYGSIYFNITDKSGALLKNKKTGVNNRHFRVFKDLQSMKDWLNKE